MVLGGVAAKHPGSNHRDVGCARGWPRVVRNGGFQDRRLLIRGLVDAAVALGEYVRLNISPRVEGR